MATVAVRHSWGSSGCGDSDCGDAGCGDAGWAWHCSTAVTSPLTRGWLSEYVWANSSEVASSVEACGQRATSPMAVTTATNARAMRRVSRGWVIPPSGTASCECAWECVAGRAAGFVAWCRPIRTIVNYFQ